MDIHEQTHGAVSVLKPQGPLVTSDAQQFSERLKDIASRSLGRVVVDASAVAYVDSAGLEVLADVCEQMAGSGQGLKICGVNETLREVLELTDLAGLVEHFEDVHAAVRSFL